MDEAVAVGADEGVSHIHSCWTYWGHSGAPLFDQRGSVCGLHSSWDDKNGARHAQKLATLHSALSRVAAPKEAPKAKVVGKAAMGAKAKASAAAPKGKKRVADEDDDEEDGGVPLAQRMRARLAAEIGT